MQISSRAEAEANSSGDAGTSEESAASKGIDTSRVFTTGFSFGGAMSYKLACVRPDAFRAAIIYDGGPVSGNDPAECTTPSHGFNRMV